MIKRKFPFDEMKHVIQIILCITLQTYASVGVENIPNQEYTIFYFVFSLTLRFKESSIVTMSIGLKAVTFCQFSMNPSQKYYLL